jgi:hypothetical protein
MRNGTGEKRPRVFASKINLPRAAPRLIPTCAGGFNGFSPNAIEASDRYSELFFADFLELGSRSGRPIPRSLHLPQQEAVARAFRRVFWEWPYNFAEFGQVRRGNFRSLRFQAQGKDWGRRKHVPIKR